MEQWKDLLAFNRNERRGAWLLLTLLLLSTGLRMVLQQRMPNRQHALHIEHILADTTLAPGSWQREGVAGRSQQRPSTRTDSLFFFDPNTIDAATWQLLGLSERQAAAITSYVQRGGRFRTKEDLQRSFVISDRFYAKVAPWVQIVPQEEVTRPGQYTSSSTKTRHHTQQERRMVCLNQADTAQLRQLRGVGVVLAERIVNYRNALGGFHHPEQISEVFGVRDEVVQNNLHMITLNSTPLRTININTLSADQLRQHPYINQRLAYLITEIRSQYPITSEAELRRHLPPGTEINPHIWQYLEY